MRNVMGNAPCVSTPAPSSVGNDQYSDPTAADQESRDAQGSAATRWSLGEPDAREQRAPWAWEWPRRVPDAPAVHVARVRGRRHGPARVECEHLQVERFHEQYAAHRYPAAVGADV